MMSSERLDDAARAAWLYYVGGNTQDQVAVKLGVSRQVAQRLVSLAAEAGLVKIRIDHAIGSCLALADQLGRRYRLRLCEIVPTDPGAPESVSGVARAAAAEMERWLRRPDPVVMALGTGRTIRAVVGQMLHLDCPQHRAVSLAGTITPTGCDDQHAVIYAMSSRMTGRVFPLPLPTFATSRQERRMLHDMKLVKPVLALAEEADVAFVSIGSLAEGQSALRADGFIGLHEHEDLCRAGAVGEIVGWAFNASGRLLKSGLNTRVASAPLPQPRRTLVVGVSLGAHKVLPLRAALSGGLINGLVTDEATARAILTEAN